MQIAPSGLERAALPESGNRGHDSFPSHASPFSEGRLAAHVPHYEAREAPLDDVLSEQRKPGYILRARGRRTTSSPQRIDPERP
ncbi:MAG TPA: hypothetical protein VIY29_21315, partial [Ktedonobacteraceae bacterium]